MKQMEISLLNKMRVTVKSISNKKIGGKKKEGLQ